MGEVYGAHDTKLGRDVALKFLPESYTHDPERLARFHREAQVLAALNHPHIGAIYGLDEANGQHFLVLELVEGETLADRIMKGPLPLDEAHAIANQIAEALEAAHEKGIIHRDLKPANIALTRDGNVKVLDFGLAKATEAASGASLNVTNSPTITSPAMMTGVGVILGTAAYMSPEQAKGRAADKRSDVWAFGCVLYEMLTGKRAFEGEDVSDTLAAVLRGEPEWRAVPAAVPPAICALVERCLAKDRKQRMRDIGDVQLILNGAFESKTQPAAVAQALTRRRPLWTRAVPFVAGAIAAVALTGFAAWSVRPSTRPLNVTRFLFTVGAGQFMNNVRQMIAISPDGTQMAYAANRRLYLRSMSELDARPIVGTEAAEGVNNPAFSPDGRSIAFYSNADQTLQRMGISGGAPVTICPADSYVGMSWGADGIVFGQSGTGIMRVSANGGKPELLAAVKDGESVMGPQMLPDGQTVLFTLATGTDANRWDKAQTVVQAVRSGERKILIEGGSDARYLPTGHVVYARGGVLYAVPFNLRRLEVTGGPVPIVEGVMRNAGTAFALYSVSETGSLIYVPGPALTSSAHGLVLIDRKGGEEELRLPQGPYEFPRLSPDGQRIAFETDDAKDATVWIYDLSGTRAPRRLTFVGKNRFPIWSADGERLAFQSDREGDLGIFWQRADGTDQAARLTKPDPGESHVPESWSPKGERFSFSVTKGASAALWIFSLQNKKATPFGQVRSTTPLNSVFSPDGQWLAYSLRGPAGANVYVQPFPATGAQYQVSRDAGHHPLWSPDGKELFYFPGANRLVAVNVTTHPSFTFGDPAPVPGGLPANATPVTPRNYDIAPDGQRFISVMESGQTQSGAAAAQQIQVVLNWFEELKARVPSPK
jgi:Tol biopolymer transport system component